MQPTCECACDTWTTENWTHTRWPADGKQEKKNERICTRRRWMQPAFEAHMQMTLKCWLCVMLWCACHVSGSHGTLHHTETKQRQKPRNPPKIDFTFFYVTRNRIAFVVDFLFAAMLSIASHSAHRKLQQTNCWCYRTPTQRQYVINEKYARKMKCVQRMSKTSASRRKKKRQRVPTKRKKNRHQHKIQVKEPV